MAISSKYNLSKLYEHCLQAAKERRLILLIEEKDFKQIDLETLNNLIPILTHKEALGSQSPNSATMETAEGYRQLLDLYYKKTQNSCGVAIEPASYE